MLTILIILLILLLHLAAGVAAFLIIKKFEDSDFCSFEGENLDLEELFMGAFIVLTGFISLIVIGYCVLKEIIENETIKNPFYKDKGKDK